MTIGRCPNCRNVVVAARGVTDFVHDCTSFPEVTNNSYQDVVNIGASTEFGAEVITSLGPQEVMRQGMANELDFEAAIIDGDFFGGVTSRGNPKQLTRTRKVFTHFDLKRIGN